MPTLSATTSFLCEGCFKRFPQEHLYLTDAARAALAGGVFDEQRWVRGRRSQVVIALVCSPACTTTAPVRLTSQLEAYLSEKPRRPRLRGAPPSSPAWSRDYPACRGCGTTERPHEAHGFCRRCYRYSAYPIGAAPKKAHRKVKVRVGRAS